MGILIYSFALFVVPWLDDFGATRSEVMFIIFLLQIMIGVLSPVAGRLLDQYSIRLMVVIGGCSVGAGLLLMSLTTSLWQITFIYATLFPLGMVLAGTLSSQTLVSKWFHTNRGLAIGISSMGTSMGGFAFPLITGYLIGAYDWHETSVWLAVVSVVLIVPASIWILRKTPPQRTMVNLGSDGKSVSQNEANLPGEALMKNEIVRKQDNKAKLTSKGILSTRNFWIPVFGLIPINAAFGGVQFNLGAYMSDLGLGQGIAATLISITSLSMIAGKFLFGSLGDRVDHRKLYWLMATLLFCSLALYMTVTVYEGLLLAAVFQGLATGGVMPMMGIMYASRFGTESFGQVLGLVNLFIMLGSFGSLYSGWIFDLTGAYNIAFATFMVLLIPASIGMFWLPSVKQEPL